MFGFYPLVSVKDRLWLSIAKVKNFVFSFALHSPCTIFAKEKNKHILL